MNCIRILPRRLLLLTPALALMALLLGVATPAAAQKGKGGKGAKESTPDVAVKGKFAAVFHAPAAKVVASIVRVQADGKDVALGVAVTADGFILTKASDLTGKISVKLPDGTEKEAKLVGVHEPHDLAMLKIEAENLTVITWADSKVAAVGNFVASPRPSGDPVVGVVSVATRNIPNAKVTPGVPPKDSGYLGILLADDTLGAVVNEVTAKSAAEKAGLKAKDLILSVSGKETPDTETLIRTIQNYKAGETVVLKVRRGAEEIELKATLAKRPPLPPTRADIQNKMGARPSKRTTGFPIVLQHDTDLQPEECGGPLVDLDGNVLGINICRQGRVASFTVPAEAILLILPDLQSGRLAPKNK